MTFVSFSVSVRKEQKDLPFGMEMSNSMNSMGSLPELFEDTLSHNPEVRQLKDLITSMTAFHDKDRILIHNVMSQLMELHSKNRITILISAPLNCLLTLSYTSLIKCENLLMYLQELFEKFNTVIFYYAILIK